MIEELESWGLNPAVFLPTGVVHRKPLQGIAAE